MRRLALTLAFALAAAAAFAQPSERELTLDRLFGQLVTSESEPEARALEDSIWRTWIVGPDAEATEMLAAAMARREAYDFAGGIEILDRLIARNPDWAEPWNQRAFLRFLREEYDESLADIEEALEREPRHFGALSGKARILMRQGRMRLGQEVLREAVAIDPFLRERDMLIEIPGRKI